MFMHAKGDGRTTIIRKTLMKIHWYYTHVHIRCVGHGLLTEVILPQSKNCCHIFATHIVTKIPDRNHRRRGAKFSPTQLLQHNGNDMTIYFLFGSK